MARNVTVATLRQAVRDRGEWPSTAWLTATELDVWINLALAELYDLMVVANPDYYLSSQSITVVSGTATYSLAADFYKAKGVDYLDTDGYYKEMFPFNWGDRNLYQDTSAERSLTRYRIAGSNIRFHPTPSWSGTARLWYIPACPVLSDAGTTTFDGVSGWEDYVITKCVIYGKLKEESDPSVERELLKDMRRRIESIAAHRDAQHPEKVRRLRSLPKASVSGWPDVLPRP